MIIVQISSKIKINLIYLLILIVKYRGNTKNFKTFWFLILLKKIKFQILFYL